MELGRDQNVLNIFAALLGSIETFGVIAITLAMSFFTVLYSLSLDALLLLLLFMHLISFGLRGCHVVTRRAFAHKEALV